MTASLQSTAFLAKLLAPLPEGEEQVSTPKYQRQLQYDITLPWRKGMEHVELAEARHTVSALERRLGIESSHLPSIITWRALVEAWRRQCLIPAPTAKELRWKLRQSISAEDAPEVQAVIDADQKRFGGGA